MERPRRILHGLRDEVLAGAPPPAERVPGRNAALVARLGEEGAAREERRIVLAQIDRHGSEHLAEIAEVRQGIVLRAVGRENPLFEFQRIAVERFDVRLAAIDRGAVGVLDGVDPDPGEAVPEDAPTAGATWTYLMNEESFATSNAQFMIGLAKLLRRKLGGG